jgi:hypothetical protein
MMPQTGFPFEETQTMLFRSLLGYRSYGQATAVPRGARPRPGRQRARARLSVEALEARNLLSTYTVDHLADDLVGSGLNGSLRYCITNAANGDAIQFGVSGTIDLTGALPDLSHSISVQGPGPDQLTVRRDTGGNYRIFTVNSGTTVILSGLTIANGYVVGLDGGGILNNGTLTVNNATVSGNMADDVFAGVGGGGISNNGTLTLTNSTVSNNLESGGSGGGILNQGTLTLTNATISGNEALCPGYWDVGGGIYNPFGTLSLTNSTVSNNYAVDAGGGIANGFGTLYTRNTIIAYNASDLTFGGPDLWGNLGSQGHNLIGNTQGGSGFDSTDLLNVNPHLAPLQDNGGPTPTMALLPGSPAIDAGDNTNASDWDQRGPGFPRIVAGTIDIGAFEVQIGPATHLAVSAPASVTSGTPFDVTVTTLDAYGHVATGYTGTVSFSSSDPDPGVVLPAAYTFTADDQGTHTFAGAFVLITPGDQTLTAADPANGLTGSATVTVNPGGPAPPPEGSPAPLMPGLKPGIPPIRNETSSSGIALVDPLLATLPQESSPVRPRRGEPQEPGEPAGWILDLLRQEDRLFV